MSGIITFFTEAICERGFVPALFLADTRLKLIAQLRDKGLERPRHPRDASCGKVRGRSSPIQV
jgi:hypothetical protein